MILASPVDEPWFHVGREDEVRLLRDGEAAFPAMLAAIARAEREVLLEVYWIAPDAVGRRFREALLERARRGVTVRVIYDALGSGAMTLWWWRDLAAAGGEVREYHSLLPFSATFRLDRLVQRDHRKLLVVDGAVGFTGGINLGNEWSALADGGRGWRDDAIAVRGPVAAEMRTLFYRTWRRLTREPVPEWLGPLSPPGSRPVYMLASQRRRKRSIRREYLTQIGSARREIDLAHAYFVPDRAIRRALFRAAERGVRVRVLVPEVSDVATAQIVSEAFYASLLAHGVEIYAYPPPMLHAKTAIVDRRFVTIGSYNLDEGLRKNLEANVAVLDEPFADHVARWFEYDLGRSKRIDAAEWEKRSWMRKAAERAALAVRTWW